MNLRACSIRTVSFVILLAAYSTQSIHGEGFRNPTTGAFSLGRAGGRIAHVDDASAIAQNPANLMDLTNTEFDISPTAVYYEASYENAAGGTAHTRKPWKLLPHAFLSYKINDRYTAGLGVSAPYGLSTEWGENSSFRYTAPHFAELKVININPTLSARINDRLTAGVGLDLFYSELELKTYLPFSGLSPIFNDGDLALNSSGVGVGGNAGVTFQLTEKQRVAMTFRTPVSVSYEGDYRYSYLPFVLPAALAQQGDFSSHITFPTVIALGYGIELPHNVRLETDVEYIQFSSFDVLPLRTSDSVLFGNKYIAQKWKDTFTVGLGGDWKFAPGWAARAGYQYYQTPVPDNTFSPTIPDSRQHALTAGIGYKGKRHGLELAYGAILYEPRAISNNQVAAYNGHYNMNVHLFSFTYACQF